RDRGQRRVDARRRVRDRSPRGRRARRSRGQRLRRRLMPRSHCTGATLLEAIRSAVANLEAHVDEVNALNVFPVPDGDTGSNMLATVRAALDEAEAAGREAPAEPVAAAVDHGAVMGAP